MSFRRRNTSSPESSSYCPSSPRPRKGHFKNSRPSNTSVSAISHDNPGRNLPSSHPPPKKRRRPNGSGGGGGGGGLSATKSNVPQMTISYDDIEQEQAVSPVSSSREYENEASDPRSPSILDPMTNRRVVSYDDDHDDHDDGDDDPDVEGGAHDPLPPPPPSSTKPAPDRGEVKDISHSTDAEKRRHRSANGEDYGSEQDEDDEVKVEKPRLNATYGQRGAFPGLEDHDPDELFYGPAEDGLEYLRMVRSEANLLPCVFMAKTTATATTSSSIAVETNEVAQKNMNGGDAKNRPHDSGLQVEETSETPEKVSPSEGGGYYSDGAYIATSTAPSVSKASHSRAKEQSSNSVEQTPYETYHTSLKLRYNLLRATLKCTPPLSSISALPDSNPITFPSESVNVHRRWRWIMQNMEPSMVWLACLEASVVVRLIGVMGTLISHVVRDGLRFGCGDADNNNNNKKGLDAERVATSKKKVRYVGAWCWGLLGRCREVGELESEDVGEVRGLGKGAVEGMKTLKKKLSTASDVAADGDVMMMAEPEAEDLDLDLDDLRDDPVGKDHQGGNGEAETDEPAEMVKHDDEPIQTMMDPPHPRTEKTPEDPFATTLLGAAKARLRSRILVESDPSQLQEDRDQSVDDSQSCRDDAMVGDDRKDRQHRAEAEEEEEEEEDDDDDDDDDEDDKVPVRIRIRALLDMIITIVGEEYGQRDLLEFRDVWTT